MKNIYKPLSLFVVLTMFTFSVSAQYEQYASSKYCGYDKYGDPIPCVADKPTEEEPFKFKIYYTDIGVLLNMQSAIDAAQRAAVDEWLAKQENNFMHEINRQLGTSHTSFSTAQKDFFQNYEKNWLRIEDAAIGVSVSHSIKARDLGIQQRTYSKELYYTKQWQILRWWCGGHSTSDCDKISSQTVQGTLLGDVTSTTQLDGLWDTALDDFSTYEYDAALSKSWATGVNTIVSDNSLLNTMVNNRINHYNRRNLEDKIFFMTAYLTQYKNRTSGVLSTPIYTYRIPTIWNNNTILEMGKKKAPALADEEKIFKKYFFEEEEARCNYMTSSYLASICGSNLERLFALKEEIIQTHIDEISTYPFFVNLASSGGKVDPIQETKCFDKTKPARITIYVEQPIPNSREITADIGHTFIGIEQDEISRYLGFYPDSPGATLVGDGIQIGEIHDNSNSPYDVSISIDVTAAQLSEIIKGINEFPEEYDLNNYNCSDFGIEIGNKSDLNLPATVGIYEKFIFKFEGRNPADLGEDIRKIKPSGNITIDKTSGNAPSKKGGC